jgi:uncharacterized protein
MPSMPLELEGLGVERDSNTPVILLREPESDTQIPIWIGEQEAMAIAAELEDVTPPRPMTHDLIATLIEQTGFKVEYVELSDLREGTFYAEIRMARGDERVTLDARPSDAIAVALRVNAAIQVNSRVLEAIARDGTPGSQDEKWTEMAKSLTSEDFGKYKQ